jgi:hypothetical protein
MMHSETNIKLNIGKPSLLDPLDGVNIGVYP